MKMTRTLSTVDNWRSRRSLGNFAKVSRVAGLQRPNLDEMTGNLQPSWSFKLGAKWRAIGSPSDGVKTCRDVFFERKPVESAANHSFMKIPWGIGHPVSAQIIV